jgi:hypothetical protein
MQVVVRQKIADVLDDRGQKNEGAPWHDCSLEPARNDSDLLFEIASAYALNETLAKKLPSKLDARQREARRTRYERLALAMLGEAVAAGFKNKARLSAPGPFNSLRSHPEFRAIQARLDGSNLAPTRR